MKGFLLSYYEDGDYYQSHKDQDVASIVIWLWKEPKQFEEVTFHLLNIQISKLKIDTTVQLCFLDTSNIG